MKHSTKHSGLFFLFFVLFTHQSLAQDQRQEVKGTAYSLVPPKGFTPSNMFVGFMNAASGASIMVTEMPAPFSAISAGLNAEGLKTQGMILKDKQAIDFNGGRAIFITATQQAYGTTYHKQMLAFGDDTGSVLINGIYPEAARHLESSIKESLLSIRFDPAKRVDPLTEAGFSVSTNGTPFNFTNAMGGMLLYTVEGKIPTEKPTFVVSRSISAVSVPNPEQYAIERFKKLPGMASYTIRSSTALTVDGMKGYEIVADGKNSKGKDELAYLVMLFTEDGTYYLMMGLTIEEHDTYLAHFKKITRTFKRKS